MKEDELLLKAFDWYYEEGIHTTNISNEDALILFKETDMYKDYFNKANEADQNAKNGNKSKDEILKAIQTAPRYPLIQDWAKNEHTNTNYMMGFYNGVRWLEGDYR